MAVACTLDFTMWTGLIATAVFLSSLVIALIYMIGTALRSPTIGAWSRIELYQLAATIFFVAGSTFLITTACSLNLEFFQSYFDFVQQGQPPGTQFDLGTSVDYFEAANSYLISLQGVAYTDYVQVRDTLMNWEHAASVSEYKCLFFCMLFQNGWSVDPGIGYYSKMGAGYFTLNSLVMGLLVVSSLLFMVAYTSSGALPLLFPLGAFFRSLPYLRGFGGALMALALTLYLGLPFVLFINALLAYPSLTAVSALPPGCAESGVVAAGSSESCLSGMANLAATVSFATVFLPALDFIVLAAIARELANLFGGEIDITRLSQLV